MDQITAALFLKLLRLLVGILSFIGLLSLDVWKAWKSKAVWVPAGALVLSAFSIQLLDLLDTDNVSISDNDDTKRWDLERVLRNELLIDGGRVFVCVYMGYLLPEMARSRSTRVVWDDIGALALSLFSHVLSELYVFLELLSTPGEGLKLSQDNIAPSPSPDEYIAVNPLSVASRVCTVVCALWLFLLLGSAAFAGKTLYNLVAEKIPLALGEEPADYEPDQAEGYRTGSYRPEYVEEDVLRSWIVTWVCKPDYIITRSVLASSVWAVVTASVGCYAAQWARQDYKVLYYGDGIDWLRYIATAFMTLLIVIGWITISLRWIFSIYYFPSINRIPDQGYFHVEDFWIRHISEVTDDIKYPRPSWDKHVSGGGFLENMKLQILRAIKAHLFLDRPLIGLQRPLILFSRFCCFLAEKCFLVDKIRTLLPVGEPDPELAGFEEALEWVKMPGETHQSLLAASLKALKQTKDFMEVGRAEGMRCERLIQLLIARSTHDNSEGKEFLETMRAERLRKDVRFEYLKKFSWKMTALSLIQVLLELKGRGANDVVEAYSEAYDFLDLLDNPAGSDKNIMPELFVRAADKQFILIQQQTWNNTPRETDTLQDAQNKVSHLKEYATSNISIDPNDSANWWAVAANNSLEKVCTVLLELIQGSVPDVTAANYSEFANKVRRVLADVLAIALREEVGTALVNNCREWAVTLEDEKIRASVYIAGKLRGVIEEPSRVMQREASDGDTGVQNGGALRIGS